MLSGCEVSIQESDGNRNGPAKQPHSGLLLQTPLQLEDSAASLIGRSGFQGKTSFEKNSDNLF